MSTPFRIGLYGGTFDPIHNGHLHVIQQLFTLNIVDELVLVPAGEPWLRSRAPFASGDDRLAMAELAVKELPEIIQSRVTVSDLEVGRTGSTYTIDTVQELEAERPDAKWLLILGSDAYESIEQWHRSGELQELIEIVVVAREGKGMDIQALPISASQVRREIQNNPEEVKDIPESVWTYIKERHLYASK
ncbi:MAG: nicotinate (nicotinamide) nucleotide adenylyltransferase [Actinobacteria bacterium]|nr:nicotinate (nicotinamide) nucleotide adenylyltransferase [Actinomycetota bacterium]